MTEANDPDCETHVSRRGKHLRVVATVFSVVTVVLLVYAFHPWLMPVYIAEGPLVQQTTPDTALLVWYTSRPTGGELSVVVGDSEQRFEVSSDGRRHLARIEGLAGTGEYDYRILIGERDLTEATLQTAKSADQAFSFVVFGDSGAASRAQMILAHRMNQANPDFALHTGDLVYSAGQRHRYKARFFDPYARMLARVPFWPSLGNHDVADPEGGGSYREVFELPLNGPEGLRPEHNYWFDYGSARIVVIDTNTDLETLRDTVAPWVEATFASATDRWKFVAMHHPAYSGGRYEPTAHVQAALVPAFENADVDMVFMGHDHTYQRTFPILEGQIVEPGQGVVYIVTGTGGARLYEARPPDERPAYVASIHDELHSFTRITVDGDTLNLEQIAVDGSILDTWTLTRTATTP